MILIVSRLLRLQAVHAIYVPKHVPSWMRRSENQLFRCPPTRFEVWTLDAELWGVRL